MKYRAVLFGILVVSLAMIFTLVLPAGDVSAADGECIAYINGTNVSEYDTPDNAFKVDYDEDLTVRVVGPAPFVSHKIDMAFSDYLSWTVSDETDDGTETSYTDTVEVSDYAWIGTGLYKVTAKGVLANGDECSTTVYIRITGNDPISTMVGIIALILVGMGVIGLMAVIIALWLAGPTGCLWWYLLLRTIPFTAVLTMVTMVTGSAGTPSPGAGETTGDEDTPQVPSSSQDTSGDDQKTGDEDMPQVPSASQDTSGGGIKFRPKISILAIGCALLSAIGFVLLFQQMGVAYPTTTVVVISLVLALVAGIILPTIAMTFSRKRK
ncbi:hypothetical protein ACFLTQ_00260 [Chloroflexota bacterium]